MMDYTIIQTLKCEDNTIIISDEDNGTPKNKVAKSNKTKPKRKVSLEKKEKNVETLIVTQKVKVKKQNIMCVINLNTNVYNDAVEEKIESGNFTGRIIPKCCRKKCQYVVNTKKEPRQRRKQKVLNCTNKVSKSKYHKKHHHYPKPKHKIQTNISPDVKISTEYVQTTIATKQPSLSSISLSSLKTDEISYDSISLGSFSSISNKESKLDTLIKRARERDQQYLFSNQPVCTTTQNIIEISSDDETSLDSKSFKNNSIHSLATLVLEPDDSTIDVNASNYSPEKILGDTDSKYKIISEQYVKEKSGILFDDPKIFKSKLCASVDSINNNVNDNDNQYKASMIYQ